MKALKPLIASVLLLLPALFQGCEPVEGDPNLAGAWNCKETSQIFMKRANLTSTFTVTFVRDAVNTLINMTYTADDGGGQVDHVAAEMSR